MTKQILVGAMFALFGALALAINIYRLRARKRKSSSAFADLMIYVLPPISILVFGVAIVFAPMQP